MYDDKTLLNISIVINDENKALIRVSIENHSKFIVLMTIMNELIFFFHFLSQTN